MIASEEQARAFIRDGWGASACSVCEQLVEALREENDRQNLVSRGSLEYVWTRHIADSAQLLLHAPSGCRSWIDIGTGAGFPGLVIAMLRPDLAVALVEPRHKRAAWLDAMRGSMGLVNCEVLQVHAERVERDPFDVISARAVAGLPELLAMMRRLDHRGSCGIFPKGRLAAEELAALPSSIADAYLFHVKHSLTAQDARIIVCRHAED